MEKDKRIENRINFAGRIGGNGGWRMEATFSKVFIIAGDEPM